MLLSGYSILKVACAPLAHCHPCPSTSQGKRAHIRLGPATRPSRASFAGSSYTFHFFCCLTHTAPQVHKLLRTRHVHVLLLPMWPCLPPSACPSPHLALASAAVAFNATYGASCFLACTLGTWGLPSLLALFKALLAPMGHSHSMRRPSCVTFLPPCTTSRLLAR